MSTGQPLEQSSWVQSRRSTCAAAWRRPFRPVAREPACGRAAQEGSMSVADDTRTLGRARLSFASTAEIDEFAAMLDRFERGEITSDAWRQFRLVRGTYGQR